MLHYSRRLSRVGVGSGVHSDPPTYQRLYHQKVRWNPVSTDYS